MWRSPAAWLCLAALLTGQASRAASPPPFAERVADQIRAALPGFDVSIVDRLTLKLRRPAQRDAAEITVNLDRVAGFCDRAPDRCADEIADFVGRTAQLAKAPDFAPKVAALRAVARPGLYVSQLTEMMKASGQQPISVPVVGDIVMMCYFDMPTTMRPMLTSELAQAGLTREAALETCRRNIRASLPPLPTEPPTPSDKRVVIGALRGDPYESSYILLHDDWAPLARRLGGRLLVAAPDADLILYAEDLGPAASDAMSAEAVKAYGQAERPISTQVYRWTPTGWDVVAR